MVMLKKRRNGNINENVKSTGRRIMRMMPKNVMMAAAVAAILAGPSASFTTNNSGSASGSASGSGIRSQSVSVSAFSGISSLLGQSQQLSPITTCVQNMRSRKTQNTASSLTLNVAADFDINTDVNANAETSTSLDHMQDNDSIQTGLLSSSSHDEPMRALPDHEQNTNFELMLGKAMDTLRTDYPELLTKVPTLEIYDPNLEVVDPSGVTLHSIKSYKATFQFLHMVVKLFYCLEQSSLTFRLAYDCARKNIRISWNAVLVPRAIYGGGRNKLHVDGISVYELDRKSGLIIQHRVEHLLVNDAPVQPPQGIFAVIQDQATQGPGAGIPVFCKQYHEDNNSCPNLSVLEFSSGSSKSNLFSPKSTSTSTPTSLFSMDESRDNELFNEEAFKTKNLSRKKFDLPAISESEFIQIEAETQKLQATQQLKAAEYNAAAAAAAQARENKKKSDNSLFNRILGNIRQDTCESNFDCERPEVCCDFKFKKMCCSSGQGVFNWAPGLEKIPVKVVADDGEWARRGGPGGMNDY